MMPDLIPRKPQPMEQVERADERMRDSTEFDNLTADIRYSRKGGIQMPWMIGRPLRSAGMGADGEPLTPLTALDLNAIANDIEKSALDNEMARVIMHDAISEGVLDTAEALGVPLVEEEQWWEQDEQLQKDVAEVEKQLANDTEVQETKKRLMSALDHLPEGSH